ncbi:unnamed protein product [Closterium sp. Yama58-4]|nr:unnamed protein product [Closterium sp. Yama58-4]
MDQESQRRLPTDAVPAARDERLGRNDSGGAADNRSNTRDCSDIGIDIDDHAIAAALQEEYSAAEARSSLHQDRRVPPEPVSEDHSIAAKTKGKSIGDSESQSSAQPEAPAADSDDHAIAAALQEEEEHLAKETKGKSRGEAASQPSIQTESPAADSDDHAIAAALQEEFLKEAESEAAEDDHDQQSNNDYNDESADEENDGYKDDDNGGAEQQEELDGDFALAMKLASEELKNAGLSSNEPPTAGRSLTRLFTRSNSVLHSMRVNSGRLPSLRESLSSHQTLTERLAVYGLRELPMVGDGNCQFRALADQLFRNANRHAAVRQAVVQQMRAHSERYSPYVPDSFSRYLRHMARNGEWGDHITLQAAADKYGAKINLITSYPGDQFLIEIFPCQGKPTKELWLSFWAEVHYNSVYSAESLPPPQPKKKHWLAHPRAVESVAVVWEGFGQHPRSIGAASAQHPRSIRAAFAAQHPHSIRAASGQHSRSIRAAFGQRSGSMSTNLGPGSNLEGILKWSLAHSDGTGPARQITEEERQWFNQAMQAAVVDIVQRMKEISMVMAVTEEGLLSQGVTVEEMAGMLEELQEHVESIDMANDLKAIGGLEPLLRFLKSPHAILRARAAEVVTTMDQGCGGDFILGAP